ncbi:MAG: DsrE family protein [Candidatus Hermodarchaeota archaeon]
MNSIVIICEDGPFGKNSVVESIRMAAGLLAVGDVEICKVILLQDAVYFLNKALEPKALNMNNFDNIFRLIELSELEIYVHDEALEHIGINFDDLILQENIRVVDIREIAQLISNADMTFKY